jgi:hypothetical protein
MCEVFVLLLAAALVGAAYTAGWRIDPPYRRTAPTPVPPIHAPSPPKRPPIPTREAPRVEAPLPALETQCRIRRITYRDGSTETRHTRCDEHDDDEAFFHEVPRGALVITDTAHWVP